jgi:hypothetical protein
VQPRDLAGRTEGGRLILTEWPQIGTPFNPYRRFRGLFIPEQIASCEWLSHGSKLVYGVFCRFGGANGIVYPAVGTVANRIGIGKTQVRHYIRELESNRLIEVERSTSGKTNRVRFLWHEIFQNSGDLLKPPWNSEYLPIQKTADSPPEVPETYGHSDPTALKHAKSDIDIQITAFFTKACFSIPRGHPPIAKIMELLRNSANPNDVLECFLNDYRVRIRSAPRSWPHLVVSLEHWLTQNGAGGIQRFGSDLLRLPPCRKCGGNFEPVPDGSLQAQCSKCRQSVRVEL